MLDKLKSFFKKNKAVIAFSLLMVFSVLLGYNTEKDKIETENEAKRIAEAEAYIKNNGSASEKINVLDEEKVLSEAFPDSTLPDEPLVTKEDLEVASKKVFSLSYPISNAIVKDYSKTPVYYKTTDDWRSHEAVDISASVGDAVKASEAGTIKKVGKDSLLGYYIIISHEDGFESAYYNLHAEVTVQDGQKVEKGHTIGYVGESSPLERADGAHLHFELIKNGQKVNPKEYIK